MIEQGAMHPDIEQALFTEEDIAAMVKRMGAEISRDYQGKDLVLIAVLRGAVVFMGDLMRSIDVPLAIDFMAVSSYGDKAKSSGVVRIVKDLDMDIKGRDVLIVEDIVDTGHSMDFLYRQFQARGARSLRLAVLVDKNERREVPVTSHFVGFTLPSGFVVGYGLDYAESYRELPAIYEAEIEE